MPTLRLLHRYPSILPRLTVDHGATKAILRGAQCMVPGLRSAEMPQDDVGRGMTVQLVCVHKEMAFAVGTAEMSTAEIKEAEGGRGVTVLHFLGDGLWADA
eukprot:Polyplicarium_translucidae@DN2892_c0_g1_i11.p6